jgi:hypothetical protein
MTAAITLRLAGVPVEIRADASEDRAILERCYRDARDSHATDETPLRASLLDERRHDAEQADSWRIAIEGRPPADESNAIDAVRRFNHELVHGVMLRAPHLFFVHAGVVALDGRAIVLPGLSRAGKSTLVLALLERGAAFLSDELLVFDVERAVAVPFPRAIKIRDESYDYFPRLVDRMVGGGEGRFLPASLVAPLSTAVPIRTIVAPRWSPAGDDALTPISRGEGLLHVTASALNFGTHRTTSVAHLATLVADTTACTLTWRDPHEAAKAIANVHAS